MQGQTRPEISPENDVGDTRIARRNLRAHVLSAREALTPKQHEAHSAAVCAGLEQAFPELISQRVGFCWPIRNEPDLRPLIARWTAAAQPGFMALLPVVEAPDRPLAFRRWRPGEALQPDRYGIPTPVTGEMAVPEVLLIPVNAFDREGFRLGYGGGFFDRTLALLQPRPLAIGIGFDLARVDTIFPAKHDMRLDAVVTETGVLSFSPDR
ncbi:5-formyltetrahydrofolate cyclo-ligase [uncultured Propionivibrio sp.]|uniref:5-formyltetrahydrofolate cyclo-ligase n=1 Tax=uncultured Propionivibrio sp. TaxID=426737 RepID=UPI0029C09343|nr:5-formyltetrahydrofolate cyclo-ligase [uncultured Propionivibrio sp.]